MLQHRPAKRLGETTPQEGQAAAAAGESLEERHRWILEAARRELMSAERDQTTVTVVALQYGFYHLGRFAGTYRETFGELPSETLKHPR